jgi:hypothetical protein
MLLIEALPRPELARDYQSPKLVVGELGFSAELYWSSLLLKASCSQLLDPKFMISQT